MSFFPILKAPGCTGFTTLHNYAPNNWQEGPQIRRHINVSWSDNYFWHTRQLSQLEYGQSCTIDTNILSDLVPRNCNPFLSLTDLPGPQKSEKLFTNVFKDTSLPSWRASIGLMSSTGTSTCYQGEINPFSRKGSLITFGHLLQPGKNIDNYLLFLNLEFSPQSVHSVLEVRNSAQPHIIISSHEISTNCVNIIPIDCEAMNNDDLLLIVSKCMSGIPLFFSCTKDMEFLSLEHTHPPASYAIFGNRLEAQKTMKKYWFSQLEGV